MTHGEVLAEAERIAGVVASGIRGSMLRTKRLLRHDRAEIATALDRERVEFIEQVTTSEAAAGMTRFLGR